MNNISDEELAKSRAENTYILKTSITSINKNDMLNEFLLKLDEIADNSDKNEKIGIILRATNADKDSILDASTMIERDADGNLLKSDYVRVLLEDFKVHVFNTIKEPANIDVVWYYYQLDLKSGKEEIEVNDDFIVSHHIPLKSESTLDKLKSTRGEVDFNKLSPRVK